MTYTAKGRCSCGEVQYALTDAPLIVHCCHCTYCQRETGSAFAVNGWIEWDRIEITTGSPEDTILPSESGRGQIVSRCPSCKVALWSQYGAGPKFRFVRLGTLDDPAQFPPAVHIFTSTKQPWVALPDNVPAFPEFYRRSTTWREDSLKRRDAALAKPD